MLTNLLDNAERHADSTVIVTVRRNSEAVLEVLDDGAGIAPLAGPICPPQSGATSPYQAG
ncbi:ATP-binding protein [Nonomuraea longispora]|uniref:ATP-binding protein n=1 Tax=Nonomuraea longispora TaxID=1848320 RepID=UPI0015F2B169|nr:ATP-binding protein [Nonomuraea longispora]